MSKHTPGPWQAVDNSWEDSTVYDAEGLPIARCRIDGRADEYNQDRFERVKEANARLIAAAPDLLEALKVMVENGGIGPEDMFDNARAAIAKAQGQN